MRIQWLGHACFRINLSNGQTVITDPFDERIGYPEPRIVANVITNSHQHFDHNAVDVVLGEPVVINSEGQHFYKEIIINGIPAYHDNVQGKQRGKNIIFTIEDEGIRVCHLGDLGHLLDQGQINKIGLVNVLMIPVGGHYTIDAEQAFIIVDQLKPNYVLPMHYKTEYIELPISPVNKFLDYFQDHLEMQELVISANSLPSKLQIALLKLASLKSE